MIRHLVGALQTKLLRRRFAGHKQFLDDRLMLRPARTRFQSRTRASSHVTLGIIRIVKVLTFLEAAAAALNPAATLHFGFEFGKEQPHHIPIYIVASIEERNELFRCVDPIHVQGD